MDNDLIIKEQFDKLPADLRQAIEVVPWRTDVKEIADLNKFSAEQASTLEQETMLILYGFEPAENYIDNLVRELQIPEEVAGSIAEKVDEKVFTKIDERIGGSFSISLPMVEAGEKVHNVPHVEQPKTAPTTSVLKPVQTQSTPATPPVPATPAGKTKPSDSTPVEKGEKVELKTPDYRYPGGADPYREPLA